MSNITIINVVLSVIISELQNPITNAEVSAEVAEQAEKAHRAARRSGQTVVKASTEEAECDLTILARSAIVMANAPTLSVGIRETANLIAASAAKLAVSHRSNRRNGGKKHYFPLVALPAEHGVIENGVEVLGLDNGWVLRDGVMDYDPDLSNAIAAMNNRQIRYAAYEEVAEIVADYHDAIAAKKAARRAIYVVRRDAIAATKAAKAEKAAKEAAAHKARLALRAANRAEGKAWSMAEAEEVQKRQAKALRNYLEAKAAVAAAAAKQQAAWDIVAAIDDLAKDVGDHILAAYMNAEHEGLAFWIHESGSSPTAADVIAAFSKEIAA